jgi:hypothetical protein
MNALTIADIRPDTILTFREWCEVIGVGGDQDRVMSFQEWAKAASLSERTAKDVIERGDGPPVVQLSTGRIGIRVCDHRTWLTARTRTKAHHR